MRKWITFLMTLLVGTSVSYVNADTGRLNFEAGYRRDDIDWRLRIPQRDPLLQTSERFRHIDIFQIGVCGKANIGCNFYGRASADWGWIIDGDFEDSAKIFTSMSRFSEVEAIEFTRENANIIDDKFVVDLDVAIGYPFFFCDCTVALSPVVGYAFNEQNIRLEGEETNSFSERSGWLVPVSGDECCWDKYIFRWYGPFIGVDFDYQACDCLSFFAQLEYHWANFKGKRHTHNGLDLFNHYNRTTRDAHGWAFKLGAEYDLCNCWTLGLTASFKQLTANRHHRFDEEGVSDIEYFLGSECCEDRFRAKSKWRTYTVNVTVGHRF